MKECYRLIETAFEKINLIYPKGCIEWYQRSPENEWATAWDQLDETWRTGSDGLKKIKLQWWEKTVFDLIEKYKNEIEEKN